MWFELESNVISRVFAVKGKLDHGENIRMPVPVGKCPLI